MHTQIYSKTYRRRPKQNENNDGQTTMITKQVSKIRITNLHRRYRRRQKKNERHRIGKKQ